MILVKLSKRLVSHKFLPVGAKYEFTHLLHLQRWGRGISRCFPDQLHSQHKWGWIPTDSPRLLSHCLIAQPRCPLSSYPDKKMNYLGLIRTSVLKNELFLWVKEHIFGMNFFCWISCDIFNRRWKLKIVCMRQCVMCKFVIWLTYLKDGIIFRIIFF